MEEQDRRRWSQRQRFEFIEWKLIWEGLLNRSDLEETFGISTPQASLDLRMYREVAGENIVYDSSEKAYVPSPKVAPKFLRVSADRLLLQLRAWLTEALQREDLWFKTIPPVDMAPDITRNVNPNCLRELLGAIRARKGLQIHYQSLTNTRWRTIAPHALAFDGSRWHVRAWACDREEFRDFVISRIDEIGETCEVGYDPQDDVEWSTRATLKLRSHPRLGEAQKRAIDRDYAMTSGYREIEVRLSMVYYFIRRMNLDLVDLPPERVQLWVENLSEIEEAVQAAKDESKARVAERRHRSVLTQSRSK
ncbi:helix-turn-helix transcriptional regulator [Paracoccus niistensis]|uniref:Helix-turn-helix transcriptional regulator n=1 Tax=Paracoccus niistensis TaxID=632935 RepID=A0ABV6I2V2_9RHOB